MGLMTVVALRDRLCFFRTVGYVLVRSGLFSTWRDIAGRRCGKIIERAVAIETIVFGDRGGGCDRSSQTQCLTAHKNHDTYKLSLSLHEPPHLANAGIEGALPVSRQAMLLHDLLYSGDVSRTDQAG
jgi:hypothetical protein